MTEFTISFFAIPPAFGGRSLPLFDGYRPHLWWPRHVRECLEYGRDGRFLELSYDEITREGVARIRLIGPAPPPDDWLAKGELVHVLEAFNVVAIGRVEEPPRKTDRTNP